MSQQKYIYSMRYSTNAQQSVNNMLNDTDKKQKPVSVSKKEKFKRVIKDYGSTVVVFHVLISLVSLGGCYVAVISGIDLKPIIKLIVLDENSQIEQILNNSSTFLLAYGIHKVMAPIRISITCGVTPLLVLRLRKMGILKPPKVTNNTK